MQCSLPRPASRCCVPWYGAGWVIEECEATKSAEGICAMGFGIRLARDAALKGLAWRVSGGPWGDRVLIWPAYIVGRSLLRQLGGLRCCLQSMRGIRVSNPWEAAAA